MPLKALNKETLAPVYSFLYDNKIELLADHPSLICPLTSVDCFPGSRGGFQLHFVRNFKNKRITIDYDCHPESVPHLMAKERIYRDVKQMFKSNPDKYQGFEVEVEYPIKLNNQPRKRIADLMILDPKKNPITAIEVQLSRITEQDLEERTNDYERADIDCIWLFGSNNNNPQIRRWSTDKFGIFRRIDFDYEETKYSFKDPTTYCL